MMEAIVLAGGFGSRLRQVVSDLPKPMAPIAGEPFLSFILDDLLHKGISHVVMAVGYKKECIISYYHSSYCGMRIDYSIEDKPLGTGGAIKKALEMCLNDDVFVVNGDTYFDVDLIALNKDFQNSQADIILAAKRMYDFSRYGALKLNDDDRVMAFLEKAVCSEGLINGGIYVIRSNLLADCPEAFSMEAFLQSNTQSIRLFASENDGYFIDIGIPEDYAKAQHDFQQRRKNL